MGLLSNYDGESPEDFQMQEGVVGDIWRIQKTLLQARQAERHELWKEFY